MNTWLLLLNGRTFIPVKTWKDEARTLPAEKDALYQEYYRLNEEVREVETIRRTAENIMA